MVTVPRPPPMASVQREYDKAAEVGRALVPDPEAALAKETARKLRFGSVDRYRWPSEELWVKPKLPDGTRPPGISIEKVWRDPKTGRFMKAHPDYKPPVMRRKTAPSPR